MPATDLAMTINHSQSVPSASEKEETWIPIWFRSTLTKSKSTLTSSFGLLRRSLKDDYPLWIGSMWMLSKQQQQQQNFCLPTASSTRISSKTESELGSSTGGIWQNATPNLLVDAVVLGILFAYKQNHDEKYRKRLNRRDGEGEDGGDHEEKTNSNGDEKKGDAETKENEEPIDELRRLLKQNIIDTSNQLHMPRTETKPIGMRSTPDLQHLLLNQPVPLATKAKNRYVELLIHNVSHADLVLSLEAPPTSSSSSSPGGANDKDSYCLCRPRFSAFDAYSQRLVDAVKGNHPQKNLNSVIQFPRYERNDETHKPQQPSAICRGDIPTGFRLTDEIEEMGGGHDDKTNRLLRVSQSELKDLRICGRDAKRVTDYSASSPDGLLKINAVFFPLLATIMPLWAAKIKEKYVSSTCVSSFSSMPLPFDNPKQVLILVSGVGQPQNWTHSSEGNSTQRCAELMKIFLQTIYPELVVVLIHSDMNIFRYEENIAFVQQQLLPRVQEYRDAHAKGLPYPDEVALLPPNQYDNIDKDLPFSTEWRKSFSITLTIADGSPARNYAIQAALRTFKPTYYHFWQLKTFWHESKIVNSDIEVHSFEDMETLPPVETNQLQDKPLVKQVVDEMKKFRDDFTRILNESPEDSNDIRSFWLRKTHKPVISVLAVQTSNGKVKLYRGTNMEVSMPTGSLCAERNVIGTALADNPSLKRQDLKMIAVLAVPHPKELKPSTGISRLHRTLSMSSIRTVASTLDDEYANGRLSLMPSRNSSIGEEEERFHPNTFVRDEIQTDTDVLQSEEKTADSPRTARTIYLYDKQHLKPRKQKRAVVVHSHADINPLRPCGACNEWLKKVAESNPYFTILTFTDSACNGVYCAPCEE